VDPSLRRALLNLRRYGFLLEWDTKLPSVATTVAGEPIRGSWWGHPKGHEIHFVAERTASNPDVIVTKLVSGKVTYVHRKLWSDIFAIGTARQDWQMNGLSRAAKKLLALVDKSGWIRTDKMDIERTLKGGVGDAARELESRLLVRSSEIHTERGKHAKKLETWKIWAKEAGFVRVNIDPELAKLQLEKILAALNRQFGAKNSLPWSQFNPPDGSP
jgi:hypothetical protein